MPSAKVYWSETAATLILAAVIAGAPPSLAAEQPTLSPGAPTIDGPIDSKTAKWISLPTSRDLANAYPPNAMEHSKSGKAVMRCKVRPTGDLVSCVVISETPADYGFGAATLSLAPLFRLRGGPFGPNASIDIPLSFDVYP